MNRAQDGPESEIYGLMAEFDDPGELRRAVRRARDKGYRRMDAYTPFPIEGLAQEIGFRKTRLAALVLGSGIVGAVVGFAFQYWVSVVSYPLNVGGRPLNSWPAFIPVTFEVTILFASVSAVVGMIALNGLPMPYHPVFNVPRFTEASHDRFFLTIESSDPVFERDRTRRFLESLGPRSVNEVDL